MAATLRSGTGGSDETGASSRATLAVRCAPAGTSPARADPWAFTSRLAINSMTTTQLRLAPTPCTAPSDIVEESQPLERRAIAESRTDAGDLGAPVVVAHIGRASRRSNPS